MALLLAWALLCGLPACTGNAGGSPVPPETQPSGASRSGSAEPSPLSPQPLAWAPVALPGDPTVATVTAYRQQLLVGTTVPGDPDTAGLVSLRDGVASPLPVVAASGYGRQARWLSIVADGTGSLVAVGGARGGAHANVRWTVWQGSLGSGLHEQEQTFETFGGWGAGDLLAAVAAPAGPAIVGSWAGVQTGLDAAVWLPHGSRWVRQDPAGTALQSTPRALVGPVAATADGPAVLVVGSVVRLDGAVSSLPALWRSRGHATGWEQQVLAENGSSGEATAVACGASACTVAGRLDEHLAVWRVGEGVERLGPVPAPPLPAPERPCVALAGDDALVGIPAGTTSTLLREHAGAWTGYTGPPGAVRALAVIGPVVYAVSTDGSGADRLWQASVAGAPLGPPLG